MAIMLLLMALLVHIAVQRHLYLQRNAVQALQTRVSTRNSCTDLARTFTPTRTTMLWGFKFALRTPSTHGRCSALLVVLLLHLRQHQHQHQHRLHHLLHHHRRLHVPSEILWIALQVVRVQAINAAQIRALAHQRTVTSTVVLRARATIALPGD